MAAGQLWLFPPPQPLVERLGKDFFQNLPAQPAVYLFCGDSEGVLYVGSTKNLRKRLAAYRVANPERFPRRLIRLMHRVRRIEFDLCPDETAARFREEALIGSLSPSFNRAGKVWPQERNRPASRPDRVANPFPRSFGVSEALGSDKQLLLVPPSPGGDREATP